MWLGRSRRQREWSTDRTAETSLSVDVEDQCQNLTYLGQGDPLGGSPMPMSAERAMLLVEIMGRLHPYLLRRFLEQREDP